MAFTKTAGVEYGTPAITLSTTAASGSNQTAIRTDGQLIAFDAVDPTTLSSGGSSSVGTAAVASRRDHAHAIFTVTAAATQAQMEAASVTDAYVSPGRIKYDPGVFKGFAYITFSGGTPTATDSQNVSSIADKGTGETRIYWDTDFDSANYIVIGNTRQVESTSTSSLLTTNQVSEAEMDVITYNSTSGVAIDEVLMLAAWGLQ